ncbi:hypothetical protein [Hymenobacter cheonanensis]|uniref:hypothetical protein n=1 Tax=Hymenobacter sp. CA2-7 TaxID=3063993 RepID=UPI0027136F87|nr:hypothetical protein [Hymenobacter sp. CA2-7]MDO7885995.1 hypothetical protein [Hymenobacter sp. CA2-7]
MRTLHVEASDGELLTGQLPESWAEVPFRPYVDLVATARPVPACITPTAHAYISEAGCNALAHLLGLPTGEPLYSRASRLLSLYELAPWLFVGPLPLAEELVTGFTHLGTHYRYASAAELGPVAAANRERVLLWYLRETDGNPLHCLPQLLATLYTPDGVAPTAEYMRAGAQSFEHLPMSLAWPFLLQFIVPEVLAPNDVTRYLALRPMVGQTLHALEATATATPPARPHLMLRWLSRAWRRATTRPLFLP